MNLAKKTLLKLAFPKVCYILKFGILIGLGNPWIAT